MQTTSQAVLSRIFKEISGVACTFVMDLLKNTEIVNKKVQWLAVFEPMTDLLRGTYSTPVPKAAPGMIIVDKSFGMVTFNECFND